MADPMRSYEEYRARIDALPRFGEDYRDPATCEFALAELKAGLTFWRAALKELDRLAAGMTWGQYCTDLATIHAYIRILKSWRDGLLRLQAANLERLAALDHAKGMNQTREGPPSP